MIPIVNIEIEDFIFHVVHHGAPEPILMDHTPITGFETFFKDRIKEVLEGNRFNFTEQSTFLNSIKRIDLDPRLFLEESKELARIFHQHQNKRIKPGVMILIRAKIDDIRKYLLIKYDHEGVITYKTINKEAILEEISNTFSKSKEALQKSAIINLDEKVIGAVIIDKSERNDITDFFKGFLGVKRYYDKSALTKIVSDCFIETIKEHRVNLPGEFTSQASITFYEYVQAKKDFQSDETIKELFGNNYTEEIGKTFSKKLRQADIEGEEFEFDKKLKKPVKKKFRTAEGVTIQYNTTAESTVKIKTTNEETKITITTRKLIEETC